MEVADQASRRPLLEKDSRALIQGMSRENPTWGTPRIQAELRLLEHEVAEATVAKYRRWPRQPNFIKRTK